MVIVAVGVLVVIVFVLVLGFVIVLVVAFLFALCLFLLLLLLLLVVGTWLLVVRTNTLCFWNFQAGDILGVSQKLGEKRSSKRILEPEISGLCLESI